MRGFPIEEWKRGVRRRADAMLVELVAKDMPNLSSSGVQLDPADRRRSFEFYDPAPTWLKWLVKMHKGYILRRTNIDRYHALLDEFEAFMFQLMNVAPAGFQSWKWNGRSVQVAEMEDGFEKLVAELGLVPG